MITIKRHLNFDDINFKKDEWEKEKRKWKKRLDGIIIEDVGPVQNYKLESKIDKAYTDASYLSYDFREKYKAIKEYVDAFKNYYKNNEGSNSDERSAMSYAKLLNYPTGEEDDLDAIDLINILNKLRERYEFYQLYVIKNLDKKDSRLNTLVGTGKVDYKLTAFHEGYDEDDED